MESQPVTARTPTSPSNKAWHIAGIQGGAIVGIAIGFVVVVLLCLLLCLFLCVLCLYLFFRKQVVRASGAGATGSIAAPYEKAEFRADPDPPKPTFGNAGNSSTDIQIRTCVFGLNTWTTTATATGGATTGLLPAGEYVHPTANTPAPRY